jgi:aminoglycoside phosphotransferase (APT) family kinase protein
MIPDGQRAAVERALSEAFGGTAFDSISRITKGSSLVFRIVVRGTPCLLKIMTRAGDPTRHYASMRLAAEAGLAPRVIYTSVTDQVSITDYVDTVALSRMEAFVRLPAALRAVHALPSFGRASFNTTCTFLIQAGPALDGFLKMFRASDILPNAERDELFALYDRLAAAYPRDESGMVSSHNDLFKPDNILFDGQHLWLVDWEAAFLNDRYADLAVAASQIVTNDDEERAYLHAYFEASPTPYQLARFHLMQQIAHLFYTMAFLHLGAIGNRIDWNAPVPAFNDFQSRIWAGEIDLSDGAVKAVYGRVHYERLLHNVRQPRFREALRIVSQSTPRTA